MADRSIGVQKYFFVGCGSYLSDFELSAGKKPMMV